MSINTESGTVPEVGTYPKVWKTLPLAENGKAPQKGSHGHKDAKHDCSIPDGCNVGLATGSRFRLFILNFDGADGSRTLDYLRRRCGELPKTLAVDTPHGLHIYFKIPVGYRVHSVMRHLPGLDVLSDNRYAVIPPSKVDGKSDEWRVHRPHHDLVDVAPQHEQRCKGLRRRSEQRAGNHL